MGDESKFQSAIISKIRRLYPNAVVLRTDPSYIQGIPDWLILNDYNWAALEIKADVNSRYQPNQRYWVDVLDSMSFARFVYPENEKEVLNELQQSFRYSR